MKAKFLAAIIVLLNISTWDKAQAQTPPATGPIQSVNVKYRQAIEQTPSFPGSVSLSRALVAISGIFWAGGIVPNQASIKPTLEITLQEADWRWNGEMYVNPKSITMSGPAGDSIMVESLGIHKLYSDMTEENIIYGVVIPASYFIKQSKDATNLSLYLPEGTYSLSVDYYRATRRGVVLNPSNPTGTRTTQIQIKKLTEGGITVPPPAQ